MHQVRLLVNKKLLVLTTSIRLNEETKEPIPAIERYNGVYFRVLRKYLREGRLRNTDILIVSERYGLIWSDDKIPFYEIQGRMGFLNLDEKAIERLRQENLQKLEKILDRYSEIYVNVGKEYMRLIKGFEKLASGRIIYASGSFGAKAAHMKEWILSRT